ncbi:MAG: sn-glycerol-3-phosphate ABC transporter substrate-binding protein UgpB [Bdellovibrionota bacterium]
MIFFQKFFKIISKITKLIVCISILSSNATSAPIQIQWWHSMDGRLGEALNHIVDAFNKSQKEYQVVATYRGNYTESLNAAIAAYRGNKHPHILQVFEVGTLTMMNSGAIIPTHQLFRDNNITVDWNDFIQPILSYYKDKNDHLMSMPFNSSTPILYVNSDILKKTKIDSMPSTWEDLYADSKKVRDAGIKCGSSFAWQSWVLIENFSAIHDIPIATKANGFEGLDAKMTLSNPLLIENIKRLSDNIKSNAFSYEGRRSEPARTAFLTGKCAFYMDSSSSLTTVKNLAKFKFAVTQLPVYKKMQSKRQNSIVGGASLWAFKKHPAKENTGVARFMHFLAQTENQIYWHKKTGYLPITKTAYQKLKQEKYYEKEPDQEVAITQLLNGSPNKNSKGIRLGGFSQIREVINEELEKVWAGKASAQNSLTAIERRANVILEKYARTVR